MSNSIRVEKSRPSRVKRLPFLPRFGLFVDFAGKEYSYRQAPLLESLYNLKGKKISLENLLGVVFEQLSEIELREQQPIAFAGKKIGKRKKK